MTISSVAVVMTDAGPVAPTYFEIVEYLKSGWIRNSLIAGHPNVLYAITGFIYSSL